MNEVRNNGTAKVAEQLRGIGEGLTRLVNEHVELAKVELGQSVKKIIRDISLTGAGAFMLVVGYVLIMIAAGIGLGNAVGMGLGFLIIAVLHLVIGAALAVVFSKRMGVEDKVRLDATKNELLQDKAFLNHIGQIVRSEKPGREVEDQRELEGSATVLRRRDGDTQSERYPH